MPKRSIERRRRNVSSDVDTIEVRGRVRVPGIQARWNWHPIAAQLYRSLKASGQSIYFEPSDWAAAILAGDMTSKLLRRKTPSAELLATVWKMWGDLMVTESSRRRARIEVVRLLDEATGDGTNVTAINKYRGRLEGDGDDQDDGA